MIRLSYPFDKQEEAKDCGAACLSMIIKYYKGYLSMERIRDLLKVNQSGTTAYHIIEGAKKIGFTAKGVKCTLDDINEDNIVLPCIANVIINNTYKHFIVIYKIDFKNNKIVIADPANKIMVMSFDIFKSIFSGILIILYPNDNIPNYKNNNSFIPLIIKTHPKLIKQIIILSFFITVFSVISSFFLESISKMIIYDSKDLINLLLMIFLTIKVLKLISDYFKDKILILLDEKINLKLTLDVYRQVLSFPYKNYRNKTTGDILTRLLDVGNLKDHFSKIFLTLIVDLPLSLVSIFILYMINNKLLFISIFILILYILSYLFFKDSFDESIKTIKSNNVETTNYMIESINNFETIKGLNIYEDIYNKFEGKFIKLLKNNFKYENMYIIQKFIKDFISEIGLFTVYGMGALLVLDEKITFGSLLTFGALLSYFIEPMKNIISLESDYRELKLIINRLNDLYEFSSLENKKELYRGNIKFNNLSYTYDDKNIILKDINLEIKEGEKVIILGNSGSGKSTLLKLLMKYYETNRDSIYINNIDINDYKLPNGILYISQNENLFTDTLLNNITFNNQYNLSYINDISNICCLNEVLIKNNLSYDSLIEENGFNLSGGEKQRIVLARALIKKFNILVIDEGLNQVDISLERKILKNMFNRYKNKTIIVISHRLENLDLFNHMIKLENGVITENVCKL